MPKSLERDLGLPSVMAISIGAMVGSGIFILPGLALGIVNNSGSAVVLAYVLAGLLVLPAALSKAEMATAMPEAGGTYLYIERGMGPLLGTIAGVGTWFSLTFKGALALVGGAPYLVYYLDLPAVPVALVVAVVLIVVNVFGVKQTGRMQVGIVIAMLTAMAGFIVFGAPGIETGRYDAVSEGGIVGLLSATGFVFVSYAGVTKVASVAEEIENPDRNIPLGILGSLVFTAFVYVAIVAVMVGVAPAEELVASDVPMALAAEYALPGVGVVAVVVAALLALVSTANAGVLSSSRYPFAMSRDALVPESLGDVSDRFSTPVNAISVTGVVLLFLVAFVPVEDIAKMASAFQILVFVLVNLALVAFRHADFDGYEPSFESPLYPFPQVVGVVGGVALLPFMGRLPVAGAVVITAGSLVWYYTYVRRRGDVDREGAATDAVRRWVGRKVVEETETAVENGTYDVLVGVTDRTDVERERALMRLGISLARGRDGVVHAVRFDEVPDQTPLEKVSDQTEGDVSFEERMEEVCENVGVDAEYGEVVSHETKHAVVNSAEETGADAVVIERRPERLHTSVFDDEVGWIRRHAPCDVVELEDKGVEDVEKVAVVSDRGPYDPAKVAVADAVACDSDASVELLFAVGTDAPPQQRETLGEYLTELESNFVAPVSSTVVEGDDRALALIDAASDADVVVVGAGNAGLKAAVFEEPSERIIEGVDGTAIAVKGGEEEAGRLRRFVESRVF
ncbi:amino acid permease [Haladaptatus sp. F3-133]|uniref:Amino acid permease n=1 Tax=Halorutilus salinus TaxID=2487751 RepID=A0A9Q4GFT1_9EURY|nr:amino acid permease [Halorutilus salinus]MCX2818464.1 amino acid permease [Halorutilus salinus]